VVDFNAKRTVTVKGPLTPEQITERERVIHQRKMEKFYPANLENLALGFCPIESIKPLTSLKRLKALGLGAAKLSSLEGLPPSLTELEVGDLGAYSMKPFGRISTKSG